MVKKLKEIKLFLNGNLKIMRFVYFQMISIRVQELLNLTIFLMMLRDMDIKICKVITLNFVYLLQKKI